MSTQATLRDTMFTCDGCTELKPLSEFTAVVCRQFLQGERRCKKKCFECHFPECAIAGCTKRPSVAVGHNHVEADGKWYCHSHRYPPCSVCRITPRPLSAISGKIKFKAWVCGGCKTPPQPGSALSVSETNAPAVGTFTTEAVSAIGVQPERETLHWRDDL